ncbi:CBS domain-containing protein [Thalassolituus sp. LLYu03]|uniref:CBS domain-containing protein n=1 Tax=Thalassolituus sp. LLYu03 TaxID=3421656 RepID=UPI003D2B5D87
MTQPKKAGDLMHGDILVAYEGWTIHRLADFFVRNNISAVPVIASDHQLVGVVSVSDAFRFNNLDVRSKEAALLNLYRNDFRMEVSEEDLNSWVKDADKTCTVHQIMTPEVISVDVDDSVETVARVLLDKHVHRVFVTDKGSVVGVITAMDLLAHVYG